MKNFPRFHSARAVAVTGLYLAAVFGAIAFSERAGSDGKVDIEVLEPMTVRTTAYTHSEADHLVYGRKTAIGTTLQAGKENSAAADWSVFPVGTKFRIVGDDTVYTVEDYGSALVGTETIDIYRPSRSSMNKWGVRHVDIEIIEKGCVETSITVLKGRTAWSHCRQMLASLQEKIDA